MKYWRLIVLILAALAQLAVPASLIWKREQTLRNGVVWKFRTAPVDPVDLFRGRYIALEFEVESQEIAPPPNIVSGAKVFVTLAPDIDGFARIDQLFSTPPPGQDFMEAHLAGKTVTLPFSQYWVTERDAPAAEAAYRQQSQREKRNAFVAVRVFRGDAAVEQLYLDGLPLGEYLRTNVAPK
ncbi:MAG TPA: GDYXXLXY domain-containing protein [Chthoniobacterales bacterium]|jgi:uncharacterized membrane-anchored protein|nr:GDYXXLXY domain-containing protein [Chthoniobacterales bacterium]